MDLEARSLPPSIKSSLLVKLREFSNRIKRLKSLASQSSKTCTVRDSLPLLRTGDTLSGVDDNVGKNKKTLAGMTRRMNRNKWTIGAIITALVTAIILIFYFKLTR
ncbi:hypothetical protein IGI04_015481 [Brassica rapa subsp. trilocularis]|uniref:Vesicle transport v-SNARE N-terminal domain-containing protein n=1 Tax=Brassica rapa subsp. trilocularis TaxID=1813537 RepID=A0ABQ7MTL7_BRACM|nr:hypothetical protein IGI04_015481 [Brassica rapa subsp. trilocularis]